MALSQERLQKILEMRRRQETQRPFGSTDPDFPLFRTLVDQNILVYIPMLNVVKNEDGTEYMDMLESVTHDWHLGAKRFGTIPCISGIPEDDPLAQELGYSGHTCPACDAVSECWSLVEMKVNQMAEQLHIDPQNDVNKVLEPTRQAAMQDFAIRANSINVTFPIVVIPIDDKRRPVANAEQKLTAYFVTMGKRRFTEKVAKDLNTLFDNPGHLGGRFMFWSFVYDTQGKTANARDAAKNASYSIISDSGALAMLDKYRDACEERVKEFTNLKALEVLTSLECKPYDDILREVDGIMKSTRTLLAAGSAGGNVALPQGSAEQQLQSFGATPTAFGATSVASFTAPSPTMGVAPQVAPQAQPTDSTVNSQPTVPPVIQPQQVQQPQSQPTQPTVPGFTPHRFGM